MTETNNSLDAEDYENLAREYARLHADVTPALERMEEIKKELRTLTLGKHNLAGLTVQLSPNNRLNKTAFANQYPILQYPQYYKTELNSDAIKKEFSPDQIAAMSTPGTPRLTIK